MQKKAYLHRLSSGLSGLELVRRPHGGLLAASKPNKGHSHTQTHTHTHTHTHILGQMA